MSVEIKKAPEGYQRRTEVLDPAAVVLNGDLVAPDANGRFNTDEVAPTKKAYIVIDELGTDTPDVQIVGRCTILSDSGIQVRVTNVLGSITPVPGQVLVPFYNAAAQTCVDGNDYNTYWTKWTPATAAELPQATIDRVDANAAAWITLL